MAKLYVYYGAMNSGKSLNLLANVHTYEEQGKNVLLMKPSFDSRSGLGIIDSRVGISHNCFSFDDEEDIADIVSDYIIDLDIKDKGTIDCIFIDEAQFMTREQVKQVVEIVDDYGINVICYGLKNSYVDGVIFDSMQELMYQANNIYEIKSSCQWCNSKATHHLRVVDGVPVRDGRQNIVGDVKGEDKYISCCRKHYYNPPENI